MAAVLSQATTYTSVGLSIFGNPDIAATGMMAPIGSNTTASNNALMFQGIYTAATSAGPSSIGSAAINYSAASNVQRANFYVQLYNATY